MPKEYATPRPTSGRKAGRARHRSTIRWEAAGAESLRSFIDKLTDAGCAVMFGRTSDGGALSLLVLAGNEKYKDYITTEQDIIPALEEILEDFVDNPL